MISSHFSLMLDEKCAIKVSLKSLIIKTVKIKCE